MINSKILVVDDAHFMRNFIGNLIKEVGYSEVYFAEDAETAIEKVREIKPYLVTLDISLPGMDGIEAISKILEVNPATRIVMVSAVSNSNIIKQAIKNGAVDYMTKPLDRSMVSEMLSKHMDNSSDC